MGTQFGQTNNERANIGFGGGSGQTGLLIRDSDNGGGRMITFRKDGSEVGSIQGVSNTNVTYNTTSDRRKKENIATTTLGLDTLMQLPVRDFSFISDTSHNMHTGFIAQELKTVFPEAVSTNGDDGEAPLEASSTPWSVDYGRITPLLVKAIQDIANIAGIFRANLIAWFADAANGITTIFALEGHFSDKLCVGSTCVDESQLAALLAGQQTTPSSPSNTPASPASGQPSLIELFLNGNAISTVSVGDSYADLGVIASSSDSSLLNLTVHTLVNGTLTEPVVIDTSLAGTSTITYYIESTSTPATILASTTRTVIVEGQLSEIAIDPPPETEPAE